MQHGLGTYVKREPNVNDQSGIKMSQNYHSIVTESGGCENVAFIERECGNHI